MKNLLLSILTLSLLTACSPSYENYYLKKYDITSNLQDQRTSEVVFNNVVYAKMLNNDQIIKFFGPRLKGYSVVFFKAQNTGEDIVYFDFKDSKILAPEERSSNLMELSEIIPSTNIDLKDVDSYKNPFNEIEMEDNNFAYNLNKDLLTNFSLDPNQTKSGALVFKKLKNAYKLNFLITSGTSIYTAKEYELVIDSDE